MGRKVRRCAAIRDGEVEEGGSSATSSLLALDNTPAGEKRTIEETQPEDTKRQKASEEPEQPASAGIQSQGAVEF